MSGIYVLEPPTKGKVVLQTSMGPLDVELWPKEAPKAVRNFVQLCLEGYYSGTLFHRVIKSFLVQAGDPTGTGTGGESIYGAPFADEFHSRLRFNHRGLVACANAGTPHSNGSQFFVTLDRCDWLDRKNTIFGKITGDTIYNLLRLGDVETDKDDRPLYPPKILSVEVLWNPFEDILPRELAPKSQPEAKPSEGQKQKKAVKQLNVLSFGDEVEEDEKDEFAIKDKIKSIHDVLNDPHFIKEESQVEPLTKEEEEKKRIAIQSVRDALTTKKGGMQGAAVEAEADDGRDDDDDDDDDNDDDETKFDARMRNQILRKRREMGDAISENPVAEKPKTDDHETPSARKDANRSNGQLHKAEKLSMKKKGMGSEAKAERIADLDDDLKLLNQAERGRQLQKMKKRRLQGRGEETMAKLERFKALLAKNNSGEPKKQDDNEGDVSDWRSHNLKFLPDSNDKDAMNRRNDPDDYVLIDPLLEKGKEKFNKMQARAKRREREWAGKSLT